MGVCLAVIALFCSIYWGGMIKRCKQHSQGKRTHSKRVAEDEGAQHNMSQEAAAASVGLNNPAVLRGKAVAKEVTLELAG